MTEEKDNSMEDSMSPPPNVEPSKEEFYHVAQVGVDNILGQLVNLNDENILHEPTCLICSSAHRKDIEDMWLAIKKHDDVKEAFKDRIVLSNDVIDNHMRNHYDRGIKELQKVEYINRIQRLSSVELTTLDSIRMGLAALTERLAGVNSITPSGDMSAAEVEKIKSMETARLTSASTQLLKLKASIMGEMKNSGELIILPRDAFVQIFNEALTNAESDKEKAVVKSLLSKFLDLSKVTQ
jgi:hypothetical protein